jgi:two-component system, cell cycle sensor histidine kinase and response regulator CckA
VNLRPGRIAIAYAVVGLAWIFGSGFALELPIFSGVAPSLEVFKGAAFILVTAAALYFLLARRSRVIDAAQSELIAVDEQRARLVAAVEQSAEALVITDRAPRIIYVNPAFEQVSGYSAAELLGVDPKIVSSGQHEPEFHREVWATLLRGDTWHGRYINRRKDGVIYEADSVITPVRDQSGKVVSYVGLQHDTSRERALERHLAEAGRLEAVGQLAGGIAHDFNNLLTVIGGHAELLRIGDRLDQDSREDVDQIVHASGSAANLVKQLLAFSRRQVLEPAVLDLEALIEQLRPMLEGLLGPTVTLVVESRTVTGTVLVDAGQLEQVIINLAVNARDAMPSGGTFTMTLSEVEIDATGGPEARIRAGRYSRLTAADTGMGMDDATRTRVFEPFFTTKPQGRGTGLGLATAYGIVRQSGGYLFVESELGRGSSFTVYLPNHDGLDPARRAERRPAVPRGHETVLVVEDQEPVRSVIERTLKQLGYSVLVAADAAEAIRLADTAPLSLLVTDVRLPGMDGPALASQIAAMHPGTPVLFVSGYASEPMIERGMLDVDAAFLAKPFTAEELGGRVRSLLDGRPEPAAAPEPRETSR